MPGTEDDSKPKCGRGGPDSGKSGTPQTGPDEAEKSQPASVEVSAQSTDTVILSTAKEDLWLSFGQSRPAVQQSAPIAAMRQPESTFKLFVFYAALKKGFTLGDRIDDRSIEIDGWSPENSSGRYRGRVTLAEAFAHSLNAATVALAQEVGIENVAAAARELGIDAVLTKGPALALGASEVNLLDLTGAYASVRFGRSPIALGRYRFSGRSAAARFPYWTAD